MREILPDLDRWKQQDEQIAIAALVRVRGSAPRLPGARMCMTCSGRMAGSVSGGCVDNDVFERAMQVLEGGRPVLASYSIAGESDFQVGLSCGGSIDVLIEPFATSEAWQALCQAIENQRPAALGTGLTPAPLLGRKLVVVGDDTTIGSIEPGLDQQVAAEARSLMPEGGTRVLALPWRDEEATVFIEAFPPPQRLFIVGATHTAMPLCRMAKVLGFRVTVVDARSAFATEERFPEADEVVRSWPGEVLEKATLDANSYVVTLTHDAKFDLPALAQAMRSEAGYIGALGSRRTHERRKVQLRQQGFSDSDLARIHAPVGLDIGGRTPEEIALSILAEMQAVRHGRDAKLLKERRDPNR